MAHLQPGSVLTSVNHDAIKGHADSRDLSNNWGHVGVRELHCTWSLTDRSGPHGLLRPEVTSELGLLPGTMTGSVVLPQLGSVISVVCGDTKGYKNVWGVGCIL